MKKGTTTMLQRLAVYCGARADLDPSYTSMATDFGHQMAEHGVSLVYGGGRFGLMGTVANAVLEAGGEVCGVITEELADRGAGHPGLTSLEIVDNMDIRKNRMMELADGLLALPGGLGTLEEVSEAFSWTVLGDNAKPVALYNYHGFYQPLKDLLHQMETTGFTEHSFINAIKFATNFDEVYHFMNHYQAPHIRTYR